MSDLWAHQSAAVAFARERAASMLAMEVGCGKTLAALNLADTWGAERILVACPLSVVGVGRHHQGPSKGLKGLHLRITSGATGMAERKRPPSGAQGPASWIPSNRQRLSTMSEPQRMKKTMAPTRLATMMVISNSTRVRPASERGAAGPDLKTCP